EEGLEPIYPTAPGFASPVDKLVPPLAESVPEASDNVPARLSPLHRVEIGCDEAPDFLELLTEPVLPRTDAFHDHVRHARGRVDDKLFDALPAVNYVIPQRRYALDNAVAQVAELLQASLDILRQPQIV